jgi:hypothetical protein
MPTCSNGSEIAMPTKPPIGSASATAMAAWVPVASSSFADILQCLRSERTASSLTQAR